LFIKKLFNIDDSSLRMEIRNPCGTVQLQTLFRVVNRGWDGVDACKVKIYVERYNYKPCFELFKNRNEWDGPRYTWKV